METGERGTRQGVAERRRRDEMEKIRQTDSTARKRERAIRKKSGSEKGTVADYDSIIALVFAFVCFILLATFPGWHTDENEDGSSVDVKVRLFSPPTSRWLPLLILPILQSPAISAASIP